MASAGVRLRGMSQIDALNRQFVKYDQVEKAHTYRLAESEADEFDEDYEIAYLSEKAGITSEQARELIKRYGNDREKLMKHAKNLV